MRCPRAASAHCDRGRNRVIERLPTCAKVGFAPPDAEGLWDAASDDLKVTEVTEFGLGIHILRLDADLYVPAQRDGVPGSRRWMATRRAWRTRA
jgi:hypothetical protein